MRIQQKCEDKLTSSTVEITAVAIGTVFRYGSHASGPYLRISGGFVDLAMNMYHPYPYSVFSFNNYLVLPNARVVLE